MNKKLIILGLGALIAATSQTAQAQLAIAGNFNGWNNAGVPSPGTDPANPAITTNIMTGGTAGAYHEFKFIKNSGDWGATFPGNNVKLKYDAGGSNTVYFFTNSFSDGWLPTASRVGYDDPGNMAFEIVGDFNGWSSVPTAQLGLKPGSNGLYTNIFIVPSAGGTVSNFAPREHGVKSTSVRTLATAAGMLALSPPPPTKRFSSSSIFRMVAGKQAVHRCIAMFGSWWT